MTDRCNFRCVYCLEPGARFLDRRELLGVDELARIARVCVSMGVQRVRITGGEPTLHPELEGLIARLASLGLRDLAMTTNGALVDDERALRWRASGLRRITVSIDSLRRDRFSVMTGSDATPRRALEAVAAAQRAGLTPVRINAVIVRGFNDDEIPELVGLARELGVEVRLIEFMPLDSARAWDRSKVVSADEMIDRIARRTRLIALRRERFSSPAMLYGFADGSPGRVGVIAPVTRPFCQACTRLRITADGKVRPCLFSRTEWDIKGPLRDGASDDDLAELVQAATLAKQAGHGIGAPSFVQPDRSMSAIGG